GLRARFVTVSALLFTGYFPWACPYFPLCSNQKPGASNGHFTLPQLQQHRLRGAGQRRNQLRPEDPPGPVQQVRHGRRCSEQPCRRRSSQADGSRQEDRRQGGCRPEEDPVLNRACSSLRPSLLQAQLAATYPCSYTWKQEEASPLKR